VKKEVKELKHPFEKGREVDHRATPPEISKAGAEE